MAEKLVVLVGLSVLGLSACQGDQASAPNAPRSSDPGPSAAPAPPASSAATPASGPSAGPEAPKGEARVFGFDADKPGEAPAGFSFGKTGSGKPGTWVVKAEPGAPSGANVLAQVDADGTDHRFPVAVANEPSLRDVRLSVR